MHAQPPSPRFASDAINISRLLCILGVIYIHAWTGLTGDRLAAAAGGGQGAFRWVLVELLSRSAVPLLGVISGWLVAGSAERRPYAAFMAGKVKTLLVPMLLWNLIAMILVCGAASLGWLSAPRPQGLWWTVDELFCLTGTNDVNVQMYFLRDIFVCMAAAPLLIRLPDRALAAVGVAAAVWFVADWNLYVLLKPQILLFVVLGILARRRGWESRLGAAPWLIAAAPFALVAPVKIAVAIRGGDAFAAHPHLVNSLDLLLRLSAAALAWRAAAALARSAANRTLQGLAPLAFLLFCSQLVFIWFGGPIIGGLTGPLGAPAYPLFLLLQPLLVLGAAMALQAMLQAFAPEALAVLSGRRGGAGSLALRTPGRPSARPAPAPDRLATAGPRGG